MTEAEWKTKTVAFLAELARLFDKHSLAFEDCGCSGVWLVPLKNDGAHEVTFIDSSYDEDDHR